MMPSTDGTSGVGTAAERSRITSIRGISLLLVDLLVFLWFFGAQPSAGEPVYPLNVSENHRYFTDQNGDPVFWLGTTQWQLFREYTIEEARTIIEKTKGHGFAFAQVMLLGVGDGTKPNVYGEKPCIADDARTPNEAYFKHVDAVVQIARANNWRNTTCNRRSRS